MVRIWVRYNIRVRIRAMIMFRSLVRFEFQVGYVVRIRAELEFGLR